MSRGCIAGWGAYNSPPERKSSKSANSPIFNRIDHAVPSTYNNQKSAYADFPRHSTLDPRLSTELALFSPFGNWNFSGAWNLVVGLSVLFFDIT